MSRQSRRFSQSGMYHIIFRGINRQNIFEEERDYLTKNPMGYCHVNLGHIPVEDLKDEYRQM